MSQTLTLLSQPPEIIIFSSSLSNLTAKTLLLWPGSPVPPPASSTFNFLVYSSQTLTIQSLPPVAKAVPSGLQSTVKSWLSSSCMVCNSFPLVVCQCCRAPLELTDISTFLVTPGALSGLHLNHYFVNLYKILPNLSGRHGLVHILVQYVTHLACEDIENLDCAISATCSIVNLKVNLNLPVAMYLSLGSNLTQKVWVVRSPKVYL